MLVPPRFAGDNGRMSVSDETRDVAVIGGGPAGLIAAEILGRAGLSVTVYDRMPTFGRKLQMAGRGGLNLTHSEPFDLFLERYGLAQSVLAPALEVFPPSALRDWAEGLGQETFVGSSGRVFPKAMKAAPLLRAWLARLQAQGCIFRFRTTWKGWNDAGALCFAGADGRTETVSPAATLLALGGASWPRLGSNGAWTEILAARGVKIAPFEPANSGFTVSWSALFKDKFQGQPLKNVTLRIDGRTVRGDAMVAGYGIEGGAIYALSSWLREIVARDGHAVLHIDLCPDRNLADVVKRLSRPRGKHSQSDFLRRALGLPTIAISLMREAAGPTLPSEPVELAGLVKAVALTVTAPTSLERAISSAGGIDLQELDTRFMVKRLPGVFAAGEMLDWEAPTGGYLLQASFASGVAAANGILALLGREQPAI